MKYNSYGTEYELSFRKGHYQNNNTLAVQIMCKEENEDWYEPFCTLTVNLEDGIQIQDNRAYIDTNNCSWVEDFLVDNDFGIPTGEYKASGFCVYPLYQLYLERIGKYNLTK